MHVRGSGNGVQPGCNNKKKRGYCVVVCNFTVFSRVDAGALQIAIARPLNTKDPETPSGKLRGFREKRVDL